jgi:hypothetical protein
MSSLSTNYNFIKPSLGDSANIEVVSDAIESIDNTIKSIENKNLVQIATGTANAITLNLGTLVNGYQVTFIASVNNSASATTINGKNVFKPSTTTPPTFIKDKGYKVYYNSSNDCFFCLASAEGNVLASQVQKGYTFSNDNDTGLVGTLDLSLLTSANLRAGVSINGVIGDSNVVNTADALLDPQYLLTGYRGYDDGVLKQGTMPILSGIRNATGVSKWGDGGLAVYPEKGYQKGGSGDGEIKVSVSQLQSVNTYLLSKYITSGAEIFGIMGSATVQSLGGYQVATGTVNATGGGNFTIAGTASQTTPLMAISMSGLSFTPSYIIAMGNSGAYVFTTTWVKAGMDTSYGGSTAKVCTAITNGWTTTTSYDIKGDLSPCSVVYGSFTIPVGTNTTYNWVALG